MCSNMLNIKGMLTHQNTIFYFHQNFRYRPNEKLPEIMEKVRTELNQQVAPYERVDRIQPIANEFEKTPKRSIKRYLYNA